MRNPIPNPTIAPKAMSPKKALLISPTSSPAPAIAPPDLTRALSHLGILSIGSARLRIGPDDLPLRAQLAEALAGCRIDVTDSEVALIDIAPAED